MFQVHLSHKFSFCEGYNFSDLVLLLSMKFNIENKNILFYKRALSDVLEGVASKVVLEAGPQTPNFKYHNHDRLYWHIVFDPLVTVFDIEEFQTLNLISI